ncbi:MAG: hypothetical protein HC913_10290, partial [Microscillaceae bacterium]|nr:hypothetical protein [Microscillaceae bacterium]
MLHFAAGAFFFELGGPGPGKKTLGPEVHDSWNTIRQQAISPDGQWAIYTISPLEGDAYLQIKDLRQRELKTKTFARSQEGVLSADSRFAVFKIKATLDSVKALRRLKTKKEKMPKDTLAIYALLGDSLVRIPGVMSYRVPEKAGAWLAYQLEPGNETPKKSLSDSLNTDTAQSQPKEQIIPPAPPRKKRKEKPEKEKTSEIPTAPPTLTELELAQQKI